MNIWLLAAITLDGKIAEDTNQLADWTSKADKKFFVKKTKEAGVMIMGRTTYDTIGRPLPGRLSVVMTRQPDRYESQHGELEYTSASPEEILESLEGRGFESVVVAGGGQIYAEFIKRGLITDYFLTIEPILFGGGVGLADGVSPTKLRLISSESLGGQAELLHLRP
jgi:dihydrofolate reductase